jgi:hypothetical protein
MCEHVKSLSTDALALYASVRLRLVFAVNARLACEAARTIWNESLPEAVSRTASG